MDALRIDANDPIAAEAVRAVQAGDVEAVTALLDEHPGLATARVVSGGDGRGERTLLHVFADYPGHRPRARTMVAVLRGAGCASAAGARPPS